jgi:hypothetical protein
LAFQVLAVPNVPAPVDRSTIWVDTLDLDEFAVKVFPDSVVTTSARIPS